MTSARTILPGFYTAEQADFLRTRFAGWFNAADQQDVTSERKLSHVLVERNSTVLGTHAFFNGPDAEGIEPRFNLTSTEYDALYADQYVYDDPRWT